MDSKTQIKKYLERAREIENNGEFDSALIYLDELPKKFPDERFYILFEKSSLLFRKGLYPDALDLMIQCHQGGYKTSEIESIILEAYYMPNIDEFSQRYRQNLSALIRSTKFTNFDIPAFEDLECHFIPFTEQKFAIFNRIKRRFNGVIDFSNKTLDIEYNPKQIYMIKNEYNLANLIDLEKATRQEHPNDLLTTQMPIFWVYDNQSFFFEHLQIFDVVPLMETGRIQLLFDPKDAEAYFSSDEGIFPTHFIKMDTQDAFYQIVEQAKSTRLKQKNVSYQNLMQMFNSSFDT